MKTISAKELRDNLGEITKRVSAGEHIYVSYRNKLSFKLEPATPPKPARKKLAGLEAFLAAPKKPSQHNPDKPAKEIYHELLDEKYGSK
ncbi:MAG: hypothetical protein U5K77_01770 [Candidatus Saccharibacteria bacterium]|nr:hypothetical protein [Candidatus Saccharibacteria bacterium]